MLVCECDENRLLAANFISVFASVLAEHFKNPYIFTKPKEVYMLYYSAARSVRERSMCVG